HNLTNIRSEKPQFTTRSAAGKGITDYFITSLDIAKVVSSFHVFQNNSLGGSDHRPMKLCLDIQNNSRKFKSFNRLNIRKFVNKETQEAFSLALKQNLPDILKLLNETKSNMNIDNQAKVDEMWSIIKEWITSEAVENIGYKKFKSFTSEFFWTPELIEESSKIESLTLEAQNLQDNSNSDDNDVTEAYRKLRDANEAFRDRLYKRRVDVFHSIVTDLAQPQNNGSFMRMVRSVKKRKLKDHCQLDHRNINQHMDYFKSTFGSAPMGNYMEEVNIDVESDEVVVVNENLLSDVVNLNDDNGSILLEEPSSIPSLNSISIKQSNADHEISILPDSNLCPSSSSPSDLGEVMLIDLPCPPSISNSNPNSNPNSNSNSDSNSDPKSNSNSNINLSKNQSLPCQVDALTCNEQLCCFNQSLSTSMSNSVLHPVSYPYSKLSMVDVSMNESLPCQNDTPRTTRIHDCFSPVVGEKSFNLSEAFRKKTFLSNSCGSKGSAFSKDSPTSVYPTEISKGPNSFNTSSITSFKDISRTASRETSSLNVSCSSNNPIAPLEHTYYSKSKLEMKLPLNNSSQSVSEVFQNQAMFTNLEISRKESKMNIKSQNIIKMDKEEKEYIYFSTSAQNATSSFNVDEQTHPPISISTSTPMNQLANKQSILEQPLRESIQKDHSSFELNDARSQDESILTNLETFMDPLQHPSKSLSKSKTKMDLPAENDALFQNLPALSNLETFMDPLQLPSMFI
ncbi:hypothetical protein ROZALSC1DRAFT_25179, partial [Rozella allomycis CSF55]